MSIYTRLVRPFFLSHGAIRQMSYKSVYNLENLYPTSPYLYGGVSQTYSNDPLKKFDGIIPIDGLEVKYIRSSGPGGQSVNKVSTKAQVRFNVMSAVWIPDDLKPKIIEKYKKRISSQGDLIVTSDESRYQVTNLKSCLDKIREFVNEVQKLPDPRKEIEKEKLCNMDSIRAAHKKRLQRKRQKGFTKRMREVD